MNIKRLVIRTNTALLGLLLVLLLLLSTSVTNLSVAHAAGPWYVTPGGNDSNSCLSAGSPCATINGAISKASGGDTINVAIGIYTGTGDEVVLIGKDITLSGGWDSSFTTQSGTSTIDGEDSHRGIYVKYGVAATVDFFTVQNGHTDIGHGGGIYNIGTLTLNNSTVSYNTAIELGGGIFAGNDSLTVIMDSRIYANHSLDQGGGIASHYNSQLSMSRSWVVGNAVPNNDGGGISVDGSAYIENSIIAGNTAGGSSGGGLWLNGGGLYNIVNSHIVGNETSGEGGAIAAVGTAQVEVTNTLIISNTGNTGITDRDDSGSVFLLNYCDTYGNSPDGTEDGVTITRTNCLGTPAEDGLDPLMAGGTLPSGVGPAYADQWLSYDYRLQAGSPAIDAGTPTDAPATDIDGTPRDTKPDIGAYEFVNRIYLPVVTR